jgi:hypothetical protein
MKRIKLFEEFTNENVEAGVQITMYNLEKADIVALEELGADVVKDDDMSNNEDAVYLVALHDKDMAKKVLDWLKKAEHNVPESDLKELFPELYDFVGESLLAKFLKKK